MEITMNLAQYKDLKSGKKTCLEIKIENILDKYIGELMIDKKVSAALVFIAATTLNYKDVYAAEEDLAVIDTAGATILAVVQTFSYWACLILCIIEVLRCVASKESGAVSKVIIKYVLAYGSVYFMPWIFNLIKSIF